MQSILFLIKALMLLESNIKDINSCTAFKKQVKQHYLLN